MQLIDKKIEDYCIAHSTAPGAVACKLQQYTLESVHGSQMLIGEMEGSVLKFLIELGQVKRVLELGTYTGYSALIMAEALPHDGEVITVDINPQTSEIARKFWDESSVGHKIKQILLPGKEALDQLDSEQFDLVFIDADKNGYPYYLKWALGHLSERGLVVVDNTLWSGRVLQTQGQDDQTLSIQEHNTLARELKGYTKTLLPIRDGMYLIKKAAQV